MDFGLAGIAENLNHEWERRPRMEQCGEATRAGIGRSVMPAIMDQTGQQFFQLSINDDGDRFERTSCHGSIALLLSNKPASR